MFSLALALGRTVAELESSMSSSEFTEWMAYYQIEPFGTWRDNFHSAQIAALIHNINRAKGSDPVTAADYMLEDPKDAALRRRKEAEQKFIASLQAVAVKHG